MYPRKEFDEREEEYSVLLRRKLEEAEAMIQELNPSRERSLALTKLDEVLLWANAAIAAGGISTKPSTSILTGEKEKAAHMDIYKRDPGVEEAEQVMAMVELERMRKPTAGNNAKKDLGINASILPSDEAAQVTEQNRTMAQMARECIFNMPKVSEPVINIKIPQELRADLSFSVDDVINRAKAKIIRDFGDETMKGTSLK